MEIRDHKGDSERMLALNTIYCMDSVEGMKALDDNSIDSCVTDPPYELNFMNRKWDRSGIGFNVELWEEVYRVMKPGAHILVAGIARTHHRMWVALEDAGLNIIDGIYHIFGSGFPKSTDISKQIDKMAGKEREVVGYEEPFGRENRKANQGKGTGSVPFSSKEGIKSLNKITIPATSEAKQFEGFGTQLKPAVEIWCLARKTISERNIASNVLKWGTAGMNIDGCRINISESDAQAVKEKHESFANAKTRYADGGIAHLWKIKNT